MPSESEPIYGQSTAWRAERPRWRLFPLVVSWLATGAALMVAAALLPGVSIDDFLGALVVAAMAGVLNAVIPPVLAALRLPMTLVLGFVLVLAADAGMLVLIGNVTDGVLTVDSLGWAFLAALVLAAVSVVVAVVLGSDDTYSIRLAQRIARRQGIIAGTDVPGIVFLEIDGLALPFSRRRCATELADDGPMAGGHTHRLTEWETDLSSQTGASQAGILLGSNEDIPAFRWVEKETATLMTCSAPPDCAEIERRHFDRRGFLVDGGASRGNLLSGGASDVILTVSRMERRSRPTGLSGIPRRTGQRSALWSSSPGKSSSSGRPPCAQTARRASARPPWRQVPVAAGGALRLRARSDRLGRAQRHDARASSRLRDVLELRRSRAPLRLERPDTLEACASSTTRFAEIERARRYARGRTSRRPLRPRADSRRDLQATERLRPRRAGGALSLARRCHQGRRRGRAELDGRPRDRRGDGQQSRSRPRTTCRTATSSCSGRATSGSSTSWRSARRLTLEEIDARHPGSYRRLQGTPPHWLAPGPITRSSGPVVLGPPRTHYLAAGRVGRGSVRTVPATTPRSTCCDRRLPPRRRHHGRAASTTPESKRAAHSKS